MVIRDRPFCWALGFGCETRSPSPTSEPASNVRDCAGGGFQEEFRPNVSSLAKAQAGDGGLHRQCRLARLMPMATASHQLRRASQPDHW